MCESKQKTKRDNRIVDCGLGIQQEEIDREWEENYRRFDESNDNAREEQQNGHE